MLCKGTGPAAGWRRFAAGIAWAALAAAGLAGADALQLLPSAPDNWTYDWRTVLLSPRADRPRTDIALVVIGEESCLKYPYVSPVDRGLLAALVRAADAAGAKVIALDFIFDRETEPKKNDSLIAALRAAKAHVVLAAVDSRDPPFTPEQFAYQESFFARVGRPVGHVIVTRDPNRLGVSDQVVRYVAPPPGSPKRLSFAEAIAAFDGPKPPLPSPYIAWLQPPVNTGAGLFPKLVVPPHKPGSPDDVILPPSWRATLKDRIVLIGGDFADRDQHLTPFSIRDGEKTAGVEINAQIVAQIRDHRFIYTLSPAAGVLAVAFVTWMGFWLASRWGLESRGFWVETAGVAVLVFAGGLLFSLSPLIIPSAILFFGWIAGVWGWRVYASAPGWAKFCRV